MVEDTNERFAIVKERGRRMMAWLRPNWLTALLAAMVIGLSAGLYWVWMDSAENRLTDDQLNILVADAMASATPPPANSTIAYQIILPSLVVIQTEGANDSDFGINTDLGIGTGVIINQDAAILTSLHVVAGASQINVSFADGTRTVADIVNEQPQNDIAVLLPRTLPTQFLPATMGGGPRVGDEVFAVGNPLGLVGSMSEGVVSGLDRSFQPVESAIELTGMIQFDAAVNPGNSGGPLLNRAGQVIGIVTGLVNPTQQEVFIGIGFAVPIGAAAGAAGGPQQ